MATERPPAHRRGPAARGRGRPPYPDVLTPAEWRVLDLLREGLSNPEIAGRLALSRDTVKTHVAAILSKLGVSTREQAAAWQPAPAEAGKPRLRRWWAGVAGWVRPVTVGKAALIGSAVAALAGLGVLAWGVLQADGENGAVLPDQAAPSPVNPSLNQLSFFIDGEVYLVNSDGTAMTRIVDDGICGPTIVWSPDGTLFVCGGFTRNALVRADGTLVAQWTETTGPPDWSPTSAGFATPVGDRLVIRDRDGLELADLGPTHPGPPGISITGRSRMWSPDGKQIAYWNSASSELRVYSIETRSERTVARDYRPMAWLADGATIVAAAGYEPPVDLQHTFYDVVLVDVSTGNASPVPELQATLEGPIRPDLQLWFSPDTSKAAVLTGVSGQLAGLGVFDMRTRTLAQIPDSIVSYPSEGIPRANVQWSADGRMLYWIDMGGPSTLYRAAADGTGLTPLTQFPLGGRLSPDLRSLVYVEFSADLRGTLYISEIDGANPREIDSRLSRNGAGPNYAFAWRPATAGSVRSSPVDLFELESYKRVDPNADPKGGGPVYIVDRDISIRTHSVYVKRIEIVAGVGSQDVAASASVVPDDNGYATATLALPEVGVVYVVQGYGILTDDSPAQPGEALYGNERAVSTGAFRVMAEDP